MNVARWLTGLTAAGLLASTPTASAQTAPDVTGAWLINASGTQSPVFHVATDVQSVQLVTRGPNQAVEVRATGIPSYHSTLSAADLARIQAHPKADFRNGGPTVSVGQGIDFGQDVGYATRGCDNQPGFGSWPPGPTCPTEQHHDMFFPVQGHAADTPQATGMGEIGLWVNGVGVYNWSDAHTYREQGVWNQVAAVFEGDSMDICGGHAANGDYHQHFYPPCLAQQLHDDGSDHSPIYGYASDGFPIYGPWVGPGQLAKSGWKLRDYDSPGSATGCGGGGQ